MCSIQTSKFGKSASFLQHSTGLWVLLIQRGRYHDNSACSPETTCSLILLTHTWAILIPLLPEIPWCLSGIPSPLDSQEPITHLIDRDQWALKWQQQQISKNIHSLGGINSVMSFTAKCRACQGQCPFLYICCKIQGLESSSFPSLPLLLHRKVVIHKI